MRAGAGRFDWTRPGRRGKLRRLGGYPGPPFALLAPGGTRMGVLADWQIQEQIKKEVEKEGKSFKEFLEKLFLTEAELREQRYSVARDRVNAGFAEFVN